MLKGIINKLGFKQKSSVKHVKTRTPYKAVEQYEKQFKYAFAENVGDMANEYMTRMTEMLVKNK